MNTNTYDTGALSALFGAMFGLLIVIIIIVLALSILMIISKWKILKKGGKNGWEALIPYYGDWEMCKMIGVCPYWILVTLVGTILSNIEIISIILSVATIYYYVIFNVSLAKAFGKEPAYAIGLIFLPVIFYPMLGLGKAEYVGANPMKDIIFDAVNKNNNTNQQNTNMNQPMNSQVQNVNQQPMNPQVQNVNQQPMNNQSASSPAPVTNQQNAFCTNCGAPLTGDSTFCTNCGTKVN